MVGCSSLAISSPCSERNIQLAARQQTSTVTALNIVNKRRQRVGTRFAPCLVDSSHEIPPHRVQSILTFPAFWPIYILLSMELPHSTYMTSELKTENNASISQAAVFTKNKCLERQILINLFYYLYVISVLISSKNHLATDCKKN